MNPKPLLLCLLAPVSIYAQEVQPILSDDYLASISRDTIKQTRLLQDTSNSLISSPVQFPGTYNGYAVKWIRQKGNVLSMKTAMPGVLYLSGNFSSAVEVESANRLPALQKQFVQGRPQNGALVWQGPETGELFSFGPDINTLQYDGSNYAYDINGRLAPAGAGAGKMARAYDNSMLRSAFLASNHLTVQGRYLRGSTQVLAGSLRLGQVSEKTFIRGNGNKSENVAASLTAGLRAASITGSYTSLRDEFSNSNRNGFLNRVYQSSLLTPVSFENSQGPVAGALQRSYSHEADNPYFLLDNGNSFGQSHKTGSLSIENRLSPFRYKIVQSLENVSQTSVEGYKPGTAFFSAGVITDRRQKDANYCLQATASHDVPHDNYRVSSKIEANYIFTGNRTAIGYSAGDQYRYRRSAHSASINYTGRYNGDHLEAGYKIENAVYISNTVLSGDFFLPSVSGYIRLNDRNTGLAAKLTGSFSNFNGEAPLHQSYAQSGLLQYTTAQALQYFPLTEVAGFGNLKAIRHSEWSVKTELSYLNKLVLYAELFRRRIRDDVFAVHENGLLNLRNIASHRNSGVELQLVWTTYSRPLWTTHSISFFRNRSKVTAIQQGYDFTAVAGFSNVYKAIVAGQPLGVIAGRSFTRDAGNNLIIGADGFPLEDPGVKIIGNPVPEFVIKLTNDISWKNFGLNIGWEWQKGGDVWNGTQAVLDYYGRSQATAGLRNTEGYIFPGVTQTGHPNTVPVKFYDPSLPVENNRWTRYGFGGIDEEYIQKADYIKINNLGLSYSITPRKHVQRILITLYAHNILVWTAYKGGDPNQLLYDQPNTAGLDFFNLPSLKTFGCSVSLQF